MHITLPAELKKIQFSVYCINNSQSQEHKISKQHFRVLAVLTKLYITYRVTLLSINVALHLVTVYLNKCCSTDSVHSVHMLTAGIQSPRKHQNAVTRF